MENFTKQAEQLMTECFGKDTVIALATAEKGRKHCLGRKIEKSVCRVD